MGVSSAQAAAEEVPKKNVNQTIFLASAHNTVISFCHLHLSSDLK